MKNSINNIVEQIRNYLEQPKAEQNGMLSVFINASLADANNQAERPAWKLELKNQLADLREQYGEQIFPEHSAIRSWSALEAMLNERVETHSAKGQSLAIFSDLDSTLLVDLPLAMSTKAYWGLPQLSHLLSQLDRYGSYLVVLFSETEHRVLAVELPFVARERVFESGLEAGVSLRPGSRTARTQASGRRDIASEQALAKAAAERINSHFMEQARFDRIVFGGNTKIANQVKAQLHHTLAEYFVAIEALPFGATEQQVVEVVQALADEFECADDMAQLQVLSTRYATCGRAAFGKQDVLEALSNGQAAKVYVPYPINSAYFDALFVQAVAANAELSVLHGEVAEQLMKLGGVAASLYYQID